MIKIIKDGQKKFIGNCNTCGCQFSYEINDISHGTVLCPCCGGYCTHKIVNQNIENINMINMNDYFTTAITDSVPVNITEKL